PPSRDFQVTVLVTMTMFSSLGLKRGTERSPPPILPAGRGSVVICAQVAPASSERYSPTLFGLDATEAIRRLGLLSAMAMCTWMMSLGRPPVSCVNVWPPSVDLKMPPPAPFHAPFSHGPSRASHR